MNTLMLAGQKGGSGKTTLAASLAVVARQEGRHVILIDLDPQASLAGWHATRAADDLFMQRLPLADLGAWLARTRSVAGDAFIIVDTPGRDGPEAALAYMHAEFCLVPVLPSVLDLRATIPTVRRLEGVHRPFAFVLNGVSASSLGRTNDATAALQGAGVVAPAVSHRVAFRDAMAAGLGVTEFDATSRAADEIHVLWTWVNGRMPEQNDVAA